MFRQTKGFVIKLVEENNLDKQVVEGLAKELFGVSVKALNRLQASGLIDELLERYGNPKSGNGNGRSRNGYHRPANERSR